MEKYQGLNDAEVALRQKRDGYNELPRQKRAGVFGLLFTILREPMILLLVASGLVYLFLGDPKDSLVLLVSIFVVIAITFYQERKTENALQALRDLSSPQALVIRNGQQKRIPSKEVVKDDLIVLQEGDRVPADAVVIATQNLSADESLLTGESLSVRKTYGEDGTILAKPGGEGTSSVFSGTLITQGSGYAKVKAIGLETEMGKIGKELESIKDQDSLLKKEIGKIVKVFATLGIVSCLALVVIYIYKSGDVLNGILSGLTLSMSMLPEEFPVVLLIFLTLGAWRISKNHVLTRNNQAIETLGAVSVLCVDKTGTLTFNRMELTSLVSSLGTKDFTKQGAVLNSKELELLEYAKLASKRNAFDPLEKDLNSKFVNYLSKGEKPLKDWHLVKEYSLSKNLFALSRVWRSPNTGDFIVGSKGSPEAVMELCHFDKTEKEEVLKTVLELSKKGERVLGVAKACYSGDSFPNSQREFSFTFLGLIGFVDPIRPTVKDSVAECYKAGIRVIMITGDYPGTAQFIASQAGIKNPEKYLLGEDLENLTRDELKEKMRDVNIFARVVPEQKLILIDVLKANGEVVAMTGDGVNDGPALKSAHIGIAMGERGTDVARESSDLVLMDDDFTSIVAAVKLGRRIYDNLQKAVSYIFSIHIPIAGVALLPTLFNLPTVLFPVHIAFLELVVDPACSTVYESENSERESMGRPPRNINQRMFGKSHTFVGLLHGFTILVTVMAVLILSVSTGRSEGTSRSMAFATMILCNLALILTNLSKDSILQKFKIHGNKVFSWIAGGATSALALVLYVPFLRDLFHFEKIGAWDLVIILAMTVLCYVWLEFFKVFRSANK